MADLHTYQVDVAFIVQAESEDAAAELVDSMLRNGTREGSITDLEDITEDLEGYRALQEEKD